MDSPGNDLESIAGQVASGCNVIFFVTGNGVPGPRNDTVTVIFGINTVVTISI